jgi:hypothetical protein
MDRSSLMPTSALAWTTLAALLLAACIVPPPPPTEGPAQVTVPPPPSAAEPSASAEPSSQPTAAPSAVASAAPSVGPIVSGSVDMKTCRPQPPAVTFVVKDDDIVVPLDAQGCPLGQSHFKVNGYSYQASVTFMAELQRQVKAGDKKALAELANYPLRVNGKKGIPLIVKDRAAFLKEYDRVYSPSVIAAILKEDPRNLFANSQGVMLGSGIVWADNGGNHLGVTAINVP